MQNKSRTRLNYFHDNKDTFSIGIHIYYAVDFQLKNTLVYKQNNEHIIKL